jgi:anti-repressor protein
MNKLMKIEVNENQEQIVNAREMHTFLEVGTKYSDWFNRMCEYGFVKDVDYKEFWSNPKNIHRRK